MIANTARKSLSVVLSLVLIPASLQTVYGFQAPASDTTNPTETAPLSTSDLDALVAPIALYPDALVAQVLTASTFPDQVAVAEYWMHQNKSLTGSALMTAVDQQTWDGTQESILKGRVHK
jgi:Protein of unknown function (DUF3300)